MVFQGTFRELQGASDAAVPRAQRQGCSDLCLQQPCKPKDLFTFLFSAAQPCLIALRDAPDSPNKVCELRGPGSSLRHCASVSPPGAKPLVLAEKWEFILKSAGENGLYIPAPLTSTFPR